MAETETEIEKANEKVKQEEVKRADIEKKINPNININRVGIHRCSKYIIDVCIIIGISSFIIKNTIYLPIK